MEKVLLIGAGAREHAIASALSRCDDVQLYTVASNQNVGIQSLAYEFDHGCKEDDVDRITQWAKSRHIDLAVIGLEDPLAVGLPDALESLGIPTVGPGQAAARLETSKLFLRELMAKYKIPGQIGYHHFTSEAEIRTFLAQTEKEFAVKPLGLTAGKGVRVMGDQLTSRREAADYAVSVIRDGIGGSAGVILEERVIGPEFTLQAFVDGNVLSPMPLVKDYKRALDGDRGANTGSMGSYSLADGLLPFVDAAGYDFALSILRQILIALRQEGITYRGVMYGQFCMTEDGPRLIEINARFGDPEGINVLSLLKTPFIEVCRAITEGRLNELKIEFERAATVCTYITPPGYPESPSIGEPLFIDEKAVNALGVHVFYAKAAPGGQRGQVLTTASRTIALIGVADTVSKARSQVDEAMKTVQGSFHARTDIGACVHEAALCGA